ncbi:phosphotransferase [Candidatus Babeliales bacterium]|nr:phosphotransferase [Candidatus Babeliales bacterium]
MKNSYTVKNFLPLIIIFSIITTVTLLKQTLSPSFSVHTLMLDFMGIFFVTFSLFKIINLKNFAQAYAEYDLIAKRSRSYALAYPFIELSLGVSYLLRWQLALAHWVTLVVMLISAAGVAYALAQSKNIECACLGMVFRVPMTYVTLGEDLLMVLMAAIMIVITSIFSQIEQIYPQFPWKTFRQAVLLKHIDPKISHAKIELLKGGFSSDGLFKVHLTSGGYVLRFMGEKPLEQRKIISQSFRWADINGFGPKVPLIDEQNFSFILTAFVMGRTLTLKDTKDKKILRILGNILSKVHNTPPPPKNYQEFSQFTFGQAWYKKVMADQNKIYGPSILKEAYTHWQKINNEIYQAPFKKAMLHNDLNLRNIVLNNDHITLLDWELAGVEDPRKEIAHVCAWYGLDDELTITFLSAYYGRRPTEEELLILKKLKTLILLEFAWVGLSSLKADFNQMMWDKDYEQASPKTIEALSIIQMESETKPSDKTTREIFLGLVKQFMLNAQNS